MNAFHRQEPGFILPAILACILITGISLAVLGPLLAQNRVRAVTRTAALREQVERYNAAAVGLGGISGGLPEEDSVPVLIVSPQGLTPPALSNKGDVLVALRNTFAAPFPLPPWGLIEATFHSERSHCAGWETTLPRPESGTTFRAGRSCTGLVTVPERLHIRGNLHLHDSVRFNFPANGEFTIVATGAIDFDGAALFAAESGATIHLYAIGDITIDSLEVSGEGSGTPEVSGTPNLLLSVVSFAGRITIGKISGWTVCNDGESAPGPGLFISSPVRYSLNGEAQKSGRLGCGAAIGPAELFRSSTLIGIDTAPEMSDSK